MLPQAMATGYIHIGTMAGKLNGRDAGDDAERLAVGPAVDLGADIAAVLALEQMRNAAGEIDDVDAAGKFAERVGVRLAVLLRDRAGDRVGVTIQQLLEAEHVLDALERRRGAPAAAAVLAAATAAFTSAAVESGSSASARPWRG